MGAEGERQRQHREKTARKVAIPGGFQGASLRRTGATPGDPSGIALQGPTRRTGSSS
jgi:hypothetical protein